MYLFFSKRIFVDIFTFLLKICHAFYRFFHRNNVKIFKTRIRTFLAPQSTILVNLQNNDFIKIRKHEIFCALKSLLDFEIRKKYAKNNDQNNRMCLNQDRTVDFWETKDLLVFNRFSHTTKMLSRHDNSLWWLLMYGNKICLRV